MLTCYIFVSYCANLLSILILNVKHTENHVSLILSLQSIHESINLSDKKSEKELCKKVMFLNRKSFSKMSACGLFYVDATLPLRLCGLITNHIIVLLQFAFL
ncbi:uncharacterized protein LOC142982819 [Anticarsia gemmatalis]|uniref:uncharacterized protein LOC142982819 n=1 Tax=Anticarsia gemmatalis TaxID=129554 RepID=UPI003F758251